jgi:hypothetical protein
MRIKFKRGDIFSEVSKTVFSFNKREAKVYYYAFLHALKRDTCIRPPKNNCLFIIPARTEFSARTNLFFIYFIL